MPTMTRAERCEEKEMQFKYTFGSILQLDDDDLLYKVVKSNNFTSIECIISIKDGGFEKL